MPQKMLQRAMFKILTCLWLAVGLVGAAHSESYEQSFKQSFKQEDFKTHKRWSFGVKKGQLSIDKKGRSLSLKTLDSALFSSLTEQIGKLSADSAYFKNIDYHAGKGGAPSEIEVLFKDESIELFTFYKDKEEKQILDFWINEDLVVTKRSALKKPAAPKKATPKKSLVKSSPKKAKPRLDKEINILNPKSIAAAKKAKAYRDFRYGAAFIWDYDAFIPPLERDVNLAAKGPDYFYDIKDRAFSDGDEKEAHMQLSINFYRKRKWGLMTKSLELYEKKYGVDGNKDLNEFMKAVSLIKNVIKPTVETKLEAPEMVENEDGELVAMGPELRATDKGIFSSAISILQNIVDRTEKYELKKASLRYILETQLREKDHIGSLQTAKQLYVAGTSQFDDEMIVRASRVILYSLAHLKQLNKMEEFLQNKAVMRVLPAQEGDAYIGFVNLSHGNGDQVIARYASNKRSYSAPVHPSILFNTAEAYFRAAKYQKASELFDQFVANYSFYDVTGYANLRIALAYDLMGKGEEKVLKLYETAINKNSTPKSRFEAKARYVGLRVARKRELEESDLETLSFLEASPAEKKVLDQNLKKLLWLTRLRSYIAQGNYEAGLAYLSSIPLDTLQMVERRTFNGDGAEIVLGIVKDAYLNEDYARAVKVWEVFKEKYENKVAKNPYVHFIVADSFLRLGLSESFKGALAELRNLEKTPQRTFPRWVSIHKSINAKDYAEELELAKLVKDGMWEETDVLLESLKGNKNINYNYYKGLVSYHLKKYNKATELFEKLLIAPNDKNKLSPRQSLRMLSSYAESLYQGNNPKRFRKNTAALLNDLRRSAEDFRKKKSASADAAKSAIERLEYLYIESLNGDANSDNSLIGKKAKAFLAEHEESTYSDRVKYLRGVALIKSSNQDEGKLLLEELIGAEGTADYLKGLARTELSSLALKNRTRDNTY